MSSQNYKNETYEMNQSIIQTTSGNYHRIAIDGQLFSKYLFMEPTKQEKPKVDKAILTEKLADKDKLVTDKKVVKK